MANNIEGASGTSINIITLIDILPVAQKQGVEIATKPNPFLRYPTLLFACTLPHPSTERRLWSETWSLPHAPLCQGVMSRERKQGIYCCTAQLMRKCHLAHSVYIPAYKPANVRTAMHMAISCCWLLRLLLRESTCTWDRKKPPRFSTSSTQDVRLTRK